MRSVRSDGTHVGRSCVEKESLASTGRRSFGSANARWYAQKLHKRLRDECRRSDPKITKVVQGGQADQWAWRTCGWPRSQITRQECNKLTDLHEEGSFVARSGLWNKVQENCSPMHKGMFL